MKLDSLALFLNFLLLKHFNLEVSKFPLWTLPLHTLVFYRLGGATCDIVFTYSILSLYNERVISVDSAFGIRLLVFACHVSIVLFDVLLSLNVQYP